MVNQQSEMKQYMGRKYLRLKQSSGEMPLKFRRKNRKQLEHIKHRGRKSKPINAVIYTNKSGVVVCRGTKEGNILWCCTRRAGLTTLCHSQMSSTGQQETREEEVCWRSLGGHTLHQLRRRATLTASSGAANASSLRRKC